MLSVLDGRPPVTFGNDKQSRDFAFVEDVAEANILAAESDATGVYNIGRGEHASINRVAELVIKLVGNSIAPVHREPGAGDIRHSLADISRARSSGYNRRHRLEQELGQTI
jgi:UDP-glucose 4-epimerase